MTVAPGHSRSLVSICIPTYDGGMTLAETLGSIVSQDLEGVEVVVCDDASTDNTVAIAQDYAARFPCVRVLRNERNVGMDRNFVRTVLQASGSYAWFCGQDDVFRPGAFDKLKSIVTRHPEVDAVYFNYRRMNGDLSADVDTPRLSLQADAYVTSAEEYFRTVDHAPTFLAATVMRRAYWDSTSYERFLDTHYVQMGVLLHNLGSAHVYIVADPRFVDCRIPEESWKYKGGQMLFEIFSGTLEVYHTVFHSAQNCVPTALFQHKMREFLKQLPWYVVFFSELGFRRTPLAEARMRRMFGQKPLLYWGYVWPLIHMPAWLKMLALRMYRSRILRWVPKSAARVLRALGSRAYA